jgi:GGDEF domain-containing protein
VARWGGDEFVALLADAGGATSGGAALEGADSPDAFERRLADAIARQSPPGLPFQVQASVGLRRVDPDAGESLAELLAGADSGLYRRKARGRTGATEPAGA